MALRECEDGEALWEVGFEPLGEVRGSFLVCGDQFCQASLCVRKVRCVEDGADLSGDLLAQFEAWNKGLCVLLEVELAALPWSGVEGGAQGGAESLVGVGGDEVRNADAAVLRELRKARQWGSASESAQETPRTMRLPSWRWTPMALRMAQSRTEPSTRTLR